MPVYECSKLNPAHSKALQIQNLAKILTERQALHIFPPLWRKPWFNKTKGAKFQLLDKETYQLTATFRLSEWTRRICYSNLKVTVVHIHPWQTVFFLFFIPMGNSSWMLRNRTRKTNLLPKAETKRFQVMRPFKRLSEKGFHSNQK